ncbi:MAG: hypothetical protein KA765_17295 [Thermoflexales bacterium]|nr:hypothetical protein [Thermoflexales bacterium]
MDYQDTLEEIELRTNLNHEFDSITKFMLGICRSLQLSPTGREALEVATRYLDGAASDQELERIRIACWNSIEGRNCDLTDPEVASTRTIICATYSRSCSDDKFSRLDAFEDFAMAAGVEPYNLVAALRAAFADVLNHGTA